MTTEEIMEFFKGYKIYYLAIVSFKADICVST